MNYVRSRVKHCCNEGQTLWRETIEEKILWTPNEDNKDVEGFTVIFWLFVLQCIVEPAICGGDDIVRCDIYPE